MHSLLLITHIILLSLSVVATVVMTTMAVASRATPLIARRINLFITGVGIALGGILLIQSPLGIRCLELTAYLLVFSLAYRFFSIRSTQLSDMQAVDISTR